MPHYTIAIYCNQRIYKHSSNCSSKLFHFQGAISIIDDGVRLVTYESFVGAPRTTIKNRSELKAALDTITKTQYKLKLEWHIDMNKETVEPHNFLARDCLKQYEEMYAMFGMNQEHKQSAKKTGPAWKFAW